VNFLTASAFYPYSAISHLSSCLLEKKGKKYTKFMKEGRKEGRNEGKKKGGKGGRNEAYEGR